MRKVLNVGLGIVVLGILVWFILFIIKMAILLLPLAIVALVGYFGYKFLKAKELV